MAETFFLSALATYLSGVGLTPTPALIDHSRGCDVLVHEAYSMASYHQVSPRSQQFRRTHHTSTIELAQIANTVRPGLLVIYHRSNAGGGLSNYGEWSVGNADFTLDVTGEEVRYAEALGNAVRAGLLEPVA